MIPKIHFDRVVTLFELIEYVDRRIQELEGTAEELIQELDSPEEADQCLAAANELKELKARFLE